MRDALAFGREMFQEFYIKKRVKEDIFYFVIVISTSREKLSALLIFVK
jgi:hypothetical protein